MAILLIGLGRWGDRHLRVLRELGGDVWVADVSAVRRASAEQQGIPWGRVVSDYREALDEVDAVDGVTRADSHRAIVGACLAVGRPCFVETPLSLTAAEGQALQEFKRHGAMWEAVDRGKEVLPVGDGEPLKLELAAFLAACAGRGPNLAPAEAGVHAVAVVEAAARSSALGRVVRLDEIA